MKKILSTALFAAAVFAVQAQPAAEWLFHLRGSDEYLRADGCTPTTGRTPCDESFVWILEAADGDAVRLRNKLSGEYLRLTPEGGVRMAPPPADDASFVWRYGGFTYRRMTCCGWYTLTNAAGAETDCLTVRDGRVQCLAVDRGRDFAAHWTPVRRDGAAVPYVIAPDGVAEASFLGERHARALSDTEIVSDYHGSGRWKLSHDISAFPRFTAEGGTLVPALYNMALEEMLLDVRTDSTFMAGALWPDTWTRDAVYSIWFAYSWILPDISRRTLEKQTLKNPAEALQDTGTGGSWPISTDRVVWAVAAWEYYLATGDRDWLAEAYEGLRNTAIKDLHAAFDPNIGLFRGETCSMDWRTHTYPDWFTNTHIGESFSCGTNALHLILYRFLGDAGRILKAPDDERELWRTTAERLKRSIGERFWDDRQGLYACYLYPEMLGYRASQRVGCMSNGLVALSGAADEERIARMLAAFPMYPYGAAVLYPSLPDGFAYHNKGIWAVWQTPLMFAARRAGNTAVADHLMQSLVRSAALFLTHKENMTYDTGYDRNTALNSDRQLWSVAAYLGMVYRMLFGMEATEAGMTFSPVLPAWAGDRIRLEGFRYRRATLDITVRHGAEYSLSVNGRRRPVSYVLPASAKGHFEIVITLPAAEPEGGIRLTAAGMGSCWSPAEPVIRMENRKVWWTMQPGVAYRLKGAGVDREVQSPCDLRGEAPGWYAVCAVDARGVESDLSNPVLLSDYVRRYEAEAFAPAERVKSDAAGFSGSGYVVDRSDAPADLDMEIEIPERGDYAIRFTGANGNGPHETFCTVRSLFVDGEDRATLFLEAYGDWNEWTHTNRVMLRDLPAGRHTLSIRLNPEGRGFDNNMSFGKENRNDWHIDYLTVVRL